MKQILAADKLLGTLFLLLLIVGFFFFLSSSLGVIASNQAKFSGILKSQIILGFLFGIVLIFVMIRIPISFWVKNAPWFFLASIILTLCVFVPGVGFSHGGARRWLDIGPVSLQPVEFLKAAFLVYISVLYAKFLKIKVSKNKQEAKQVSLFALVLPAFVLMALVTVSLIFQPDTKNVVLMFCIAFIVLFIVGLPFRFIVFGVSVLVVLGIILVQLRPYVKERFDTFIHPEHDTSGSSYQLTQALIGFGGGGLVGQGFGQSIQKFNFLPEPQGDSIFAVVGEEVGFIGSTFIILLFLGFTLRGFKLSRGITSPFGRIFLISFFSLFALQAFLNIASISGLIPLTGVPLPLFSQGGTSLLINCGLFGIVLKIIYENQKQESSS